MRVLVTGATGFVGSHLCRLLRSRGHEVYGTSFPARPPRTEKRIYFADLRSEPRVLGLIGRIRPEWVFHLAAVSGVRHSWRFREETLETNLMGTFYLLEALRRLAPEARVLFVSSSDIYGIAQPSVAIREDHPFDLASPYSYTKLAGELLAGFYHRLDKLNTLIVRPFPHTGPGQSEDFVCSDWARQIAGIEKSGEVAMIKVGNLGMVRDFTDVRDVVRAYLLLMEKGRSGEVYNVCSGKARSLREILDLLLSLSRSRIEVRVDPGRLRPVDAPCLRGSNKKIGKEVGWRPEIPLRQTLTDLLDYWRRLTDSAA